MNGRVGEGHLAGLGRHELATYVRELLLCGHLIDRATMPHVIGAWGRDEMRDIAIDEWMGASPVYTRRMQRLLGFVGDDVATIFKGMQFDIGAPPQFMDFRYRVDDARHGAFHLDHCGALMDVEPMGDAYVTTMCHDIEDPTFDATACATNPRARMTPIHRPPRTPADQHPHCSWEVVISPDVEPLPEPAMAELLATTVAAGLPIASIIDDGSAGRRDYAGPLEDDIDFAAFSASTLRALADEVALQGQLLALSGLFAIAARHGEDAARDVGVHQLTGWAGVTADRLRTAPDLVGREDDSLARLVSVLDLHPAFRPTAYVETSGDRDGDRVRWSVVGGAAFDEPSGLSWPQLLVTSESVAPVEAIARAVDPHLQVATVGVAPGALATFELTRADEAAAPHDDVALTRFSTGADFTFSDEGTRVALRTKGRLD